ncbi:MAG TPA: glycosyl hydrolase [Candidatus Limiplasma sp.]|nr:glycosyl hydrolase [Candidatus Limiplasma sp.]
MDICKVLCAPPPQTSACAFWFWNGELSAARLLGQMDEMKDKGVYNAFMHARAYLKTPYMGDQWFAVMDACVRHGEAIGFYPWLYDEYAWPSGTCGSVFAHGLQAPSRVLAKGRQNMAKGLDAEMMDGAPDPARRLIAACPLTDGRTMAFYEHIYEKAVDYLNPDTIRDFLDCTHEVYYARYGSAFGKTIPGIFFDEIYLTAHPLPWTDRLPEAFETAYGYDLLAHLPALMQGEDEHALRVRRDYYNLLAALYEHAFFRQIGDWCARHRLLLTGHTEEELLYHPRRQGNYFRTMRHLHIPGADCHDYRYRFPREISVHEPKYAVSVARAYGKPRAMSEAMGGAGWGCTLGEYRRGINALGAMGISMFVLHGFYNECEHQGSQADWPASFFTQNPYWKYFKPFAAYMHRISTINTLGHAVVDVGLYHPVEEIAMHTAAGEPDAVARAIDRQFHQALRLFVTHQIDTDFIDRDSVLAAHAENGRLCAGGQRFRLLICPSNLLMTDSLQKTFAALQAQGGMVLYYPAEDGDMARDGVCAVYDLLARYRQRFTPDVEIAQGACDHLYANHRVIDGQDIFLLASTLPAPRRLRVLLRGHGAVKKLSPEGGPAQPLACAQQADGRIAVALSLEADEACWLMTGCEPQPASAPQTTAKTFTIEGAWDFLPLDAGYDKRWAIGAKETVLSVPLARLTDGQTGREIPIRIRNTAEEAGRCGRHISLWNASWLGRRVGWGDDADKRDLYFTKTLALDGAAQTARMCVAAVNRFILYVNGQEIARRDSYGKPCTLDIAAHLHAGRNRIAVHVHTNTPLDGRDLTQAEVIPPDALASLLLQGEIITANGRCALLSDRTWAVASAVSADWITAEPARVQTVDPKTVVCHVVPGLCDADWVWAWERGKPPMLPWGDVPLFDTLPAYPRTVRYAIALPEGAAAIEPPAVSGKYTALLDGTPVSFAAGAVGVPADGQPHQLELDVIAASPDDGLKDSLNVHILPQPTALEDWRGHGLLWFSGRALYQKTVTLQKDDDLRCTLDLGRVCYYAEIWVNGALCGTRIWPPYRMDITEQLQDGDNHIAVVVANSAACARRHMLVDEGMALAWNRYWNEDNIDREPENLISGLLGPVRITVYHEEG